MNQAVADLIADNLGSLPRPDGTVVQLANYSTASMPPAMAEVVKRSATSVGEGVVTLLENEGWTIVRADEHTRLQHIDTPPPAPEMATLRCNACDTELLHLNITNPARVATNGATLIGHMTNLDPKCPHGPL